MFVRCLVSFRVDCCFFLQGDPRVHESTRYKKQNIGEGIWRTCCCSQGDPLVHENKLFKTHDVDECILRTYLFLQGDPRVHENKLYKKQDIGEGIVRTSFFYKETRVCMKANGIKNKTLAKASCAHGFSTRRPACP